MTVLFSFPGHEELGKKVAKNLNAEVGKLKLHRFPDGDSYVRLLSDVKNKNVIVLCSMNNPDEKIMSIILLAKTARELGANRIILAMPYHSYLRQDIRFNEGEAISAKIFSSLIEGYVDGVVTVDPHLHRIHSLSEVYTIPSVAVAAADAIASWVKENITQPLIVGPDKESTQWVRVVAQKIDAPFIVLTKTRYGDRDVKVSLPDISAYENFTPVLIDDIISTARTMIETVRALKDSGMHDPVCIGVHGVFANNAYEDLHAAGASSVVTSNTIVHPSSKIDVSEALSIGIKQVLEQLI